MSYRSQPRVEGKLSRHRKGLRRKIPVFYGDYQKIEAKFDGRCTLCKEPYSEGMDVAYNKNRTAGNKVAHISCAIREANT